MDPKQQAHYRQLLTRMQYELENKDAIKAEPMRNDDVTPVEEDVQPYVEMEQSIASSRNLKLACSIDDIRHALQVLRESPDDYGYCEECDEPIEERRLELMPYVRLCVSCQQKEEERAAVYAAGGRKYAGDFIDE